MRVTIDTNILVNAFREFSRRHQGVISLVEETGAYICLDAAYRMMSEYRGELGGVEQFEKWYQEMFNRFDQRYRGALSSKHTAALSRCGCHEDSDHVFVAVASESGKVLFTEDSDMGKGPKGGEPPHDAALMYLQKDLGLTVCDAREALYLLTKHLA